MTTLIVRVTRFFTRPPLALELPRSYTSTVEFEWDPIKVDANLRKHGVSFDEAATVLADPLSITVADPDHSQEEDRLITVGMSFNRRL